MIGATGRVSIAILGRRRPLLMSLENRNEDKFRGAAETEKDAGTADVAWLNLARTIWLGMSKRGWLSARFLTINSSSKPHES